MFWRLSIIYKTAIRLINECLKLWFMCEWYSHAAWFLVGDEIWFLQWWRDTDPTPRSQIGQSSCKCFQTTAFSCSIISACPAVELKLHLKHLLIKLSTLTCRRVFYCLWPGTEAVWRMQAFWVWRVLFPLSARSDLGLYIWSCLRMKLFFVRA